MNKRQSTKGRKCVKLTSCSKAKDEIWEGGLRVSTHCRSNGDEEQYQMGTYQRNTTNEDENEKYSVQNA